ncbi:xanthine dehydrogenase family protein molybdopterin-binding subunit [Bradyrhizobium sp. ARR65]|uniref:xanthine dehydrogenase family protein molybdopterin-binding subunit n=1 Tax=Bradyrhizobium sp. ARR65 TaxID=1040989 RepID=UPI0004639FBB|nr:xanthine dehydrogenase family protein molybdopterin-binding subunit [Bradyrhizobium sp. ARR65]
MNPAAPLKFVSSNRRVREDRRFVAGQGRYVADIALEGLLHVAVVPSPHPAARIVSINAAEAMKMPGVHYVLTGEELAKATEPLMNGLDTPNVRRYPLAVGQARYAGEWVVAVVAETRAQAEDAAEKVRIEYEQLAYVIDSEDAFDPKSPPVHAGHGSNVLLDKTFVWGEVEKHFAESERHLSFRVVWGRNSTVPIETFGVAAKWDPWREMLDVWASIQMPKYPDQIARALRIPLNNVRVHFDVDVGGSYGVKRGIKQTVLVSHLARVLGRPVRLIEDRLDNMRAGDAHGPDRIFDVEIAFNDDGIVNSMKMRALDNVGAYAGRSPFQLGKPIGAIVGPYKIKSVQYRAISVTSNKAAQEAVRGFGQSPTNYAIETAIDKVAVALGLDRIEVRRRNFIRSDEFPYLIPSGTRYDSGDYHTVVAKVRAHADYEGLIRERDTLRAAGQCAGIGIAACLEPSGGNSSFEPLLNEKNTTTTWMDSCRIVVDGLGFVTATIHTTSSGQGHETLVATVIGEVLEIDPDLIRIVRPDSLNSLPSNTPVGSRMAIMLGGAAFHAAQKLKAKIIKLAAHQFGCAEQEVIYAGGAVSHGASGKKLAWAEHVNIAHRNFHLLPEGMEPGLETTHVMQVPTGTKLPENGRVQMYPCHSFEFHLVLIVFDPVIGKPEIRRYVIGHDCGTVINPHIVKGMTLGGIAHGIGASLLEEFVYDSEGQMLTQSFMDYLLPSSHEVPKVEIVHHCTPSPFTVFGQKGSGESGYLGSPAAISSAINDAVAPFGISLAKLPIRIAAISDAIAAAREAKAKVKA